MKGLFFITILHFFISNMYGQELFPVSEPASTVPKGALGVRVYDEGYKEANLFRNMAALKLMYGAISKLSIYITGTPSDFHQKTLPFDFITHDHCVVNSFQNLYIRYVCWVCRGILILRNALR